MFKEGGDDGCCRGGVGKERNKKKQSNVEYIT